MALGSVRRWVSLVAVSAAVAVAASGGATSGAAVVLPVVTVAPSTGLVDLQNVIVTGSGFSANAQVATVQCRPGAIGQADCDLGTLVYKLADSNGAFTLGRYVRRMIQVGATTIDCGAPAGCILGAGNIANLAQANGQTIFFDPNIPPKVPATKVSPSTNLVDHQLVTVSGSAYAPGSSVYVSQCVAHPPAGTYEVCDYSTQRYETVDTNGNFKVANFVLERRQVVYGSTGLHKVDCAVAPGACDIEVRAFGFGSSVPVKIALTFDPNVAPAIASVLVTPNSSLRDLNYVIVAGTGFTPGIAVDVVQCTRPASGFPSCDYTTSRAITAGFHGEFAFSFSVRRHIASFSYPNGATSFDCAAIRRSCSLMIRGSESQPTITRGLTFNPRLSAIVPAIVIDPKYDLVDNQNIAVLLHGFTPNQTVQIVECSGEALEEADLSYCDYTTVQTVTPTIGDLRTRFAVRAVVGGQGGLVDCRTRRGACVLVATASEGDYYGAGVAASSLAGTTPPTFADQSAGALAPNAALGASLPNTAFRKLAFLP